jgi:hypothetical protein
MRQLSWAAITLAIGVVLVAAPQVSFADGFARDRAKVTDGVKTTKAKAKVSCTGSCSPYANATATIQTDSNGNVTRKATAVTSSTCTNCSSVSSSSVSSGAADND